MICTLCDNFSCSNLSGEIVFPANLESIGEGAFIPSEVPCSDPGIDGDKPSFTKVTFKGTSIAGVHDDAFAAATPFVTTCSVDDTKVAILDFLGPDGETIATENDFGCGAIADDPKVSIPGYTFHGWHLKADLSDPAIQFPWVPYGDDAVVDDLLIYGDWRPIVPDVPETGEYAATPDSVNPVSTIAIIGGTIVGLAVIIFGLRRLNQIS